MYQSGFRQEIEFTHKKKYKGNKRTIYNGLSRDKGTNKFSI